MPSWWWYYYSELQYDLLDGAYHGGLLIQTLHWMLAHPPPPVAGMFTGAYPCITPAKRRFTGQRETSQLPQMHASTREAHRPDKEAHRPTRGTPATWTHTRAKDRHTSLIETTQQPKVGTSSTKRHAILQEEAHRPNIETHILHRPQIEMPTNQREAQRPNRRTPANMRGSPALGERHYHLIASPS